MDGSQLSVAQPALLEIADLQHTPVALSVAAVNSHVVAHGNNQPLLTPQDRLTKKQR